MRKAIWVMGRESWVVSHGSGIRYPSSRLKTQNSRLHGQVAVEFFMYAGVFLLVVMAVLSMASLLQASEIPARESVAAREQGETLAEAVRLSVLAGQGFSYNVTFPRNLLGRPYAMQFDESEKTAVLTWVSSAGEVNFIYSLPGYAYSFEGGCLTDKILVSNECTNILQLMNDGEKLIVRQD